MECSTRDAVNNVAGYSILFGSVSEGFQVINRSFATEILYTIVMYIHLP